MVAASSFVPVLTALAPAWPRVRTALGWTWCRPTGGPRQPRWPSRKADVWIPDDAAWAGTQGVVQLAPTSTAGSGTVLATSPFYLVTDAGTARR